MKEGTMGDAKALGFWTRSGIDGKLYFYQADIRQCERVLYFV